jgi:hypothetical protein
VIGSTCGVLLHVCERGARARGVLVNWTDLANYQQLGIASPQAWHASRMVAIYDYDAYGGLRRAASGTMSNDGG